MRKVLLSLFILFSAHATYSQDQVFMRMLENKILCKEDRLVNFLETNSFVRDHRTFHREYSYNAQLYFTDIVYDNECYALYRTNSKREYMAIQKNISGLCDKELGPKNGVYYSCNIRSVYGVQVVLSGYQSRSEAYEIKIYQNPGWEENSYPLGNK
ncbi:MAG: hypothetical protein V4649_03405 [Bacteroidota bacterium]